MPVRFIFIVLISSFCLLQGCKDSSKETASISGAFKNLSDTKLYFYQVLPLSKPLIDSVTTDASGKFSIELHVEKAGYYTIYYNASNEITLVILPGDKILVAGNGNAMQKTYTVDGSKESKLYAEYTHLTQANLHKVDSLSGVFAESRDKPDFISIKNSLDSSYLQIFKDQKEIAAKFINTSPGSLAALLVISENFGPNPLLTEKTHPELFLRLDSALVISYPENSLVNVFHLRMLDFRAEVADDKAHDSLLKPGMPAPEISLPNSSGKTVNLSSLKGKLTLLYFWSSWNAECRQMNMNLTMLYSRYHKQGFEIYAVSVDSDADLWQKAYSLDKACWLQLIDPKGLNSEYSRTYGVKALPNLILIGKDGKIISREPDFGELESLIKMNI